MFSIVKRSKREAEKARHEQSKQKIAALREKVATLRRSVEKLKAARDELRAQAMQPRVEPNGQEVARMAHRLTLAEHRAAELEAALVLAEAAPLTHPLPFPLPPPHLRRRVGGNYAAANFLEAARTYAERIAALLRDSGHDPAAFRSILDWGCGCGRIARQAPEVFPGAIYHGIDTHLESILWCRDHLGTIGQFETCSEDPPAPYPAVQFDLIIALSVFTHLRLKSERQWLGELARLAQPNAVLFLTYLCEERVASFGLGEKQIVDREDGFTCYASSPEEGLPYFNLTSSHSEQCLRELWGEWFDILAIHPGGIGQQGVVIARARN